MKYTTTICFLLLVIVSAATAAPPADDAWIAGLEGGWHGEDNMTPMGRMPFVLLFDREADGSLHSRSALNRETWVDLRFRKDPQGRWLLEESAGMEGLGVQRYTLEPVDAPGELRRWVWAEKPDYLSVDVAHDGDRVFMKVMLRGKDHVQFDLSRMPDEQLPALRRELARAATLAPEAQSIHGLAGDENVPEGILDARRAVAADPRDAGAHLQLGKAIAEVLQTDPMRMGPRYAAEMLTALETAVELDPANPEAYHWLAGYYMHAPPIAGGSLDKAEHVAQNLEEIDAEGGAELLALIEKTRNGNSNVH